MSKVNIWQPRMFDRVWNRPKIFYIIISLLAELKLVELIWVIIPINFSANHGSTKFSKILEFCIKNSQSKTSIKVSISPFELRIYDILIMEKKSLAKFT